MKTRIEPQKSSGQPVRVGIGPIRLHKHVEIVSSRDENPGIGGSEFHSLQLSAILAEKGMEVVLMYSGFNPVMPAGVTSVRFDQNLDSLGLTCLVTTVGEVNRPEFPSLSNIETYLISHHPHDRDILRARSKLQKLAAVVNVGRYQRFSNRKYARNGLWIPAFTPISSKATRSPHQEERNHEGVVKTVGHISSLHPSKGFGIALAGFCRVAQENPGLKFQIVGGSNLYAHVLSTKSDISQLETLGPKITKTLVRANLEGEQISFLGVVDGSVLNLLSLWDVALQNPLGIGEADPIVIQDCLRSGVPVIAGSLFGMYDYMKYFPELQAHSERQVAKRLEALAAGRLDQKEIAARGLKLHASLVERRSRAVKSWADLIDPKSQENSGLDVGRIEFALRWRLLIGAIYYSIYYWYLDRPRWLFR